jgi:DNA-binding protein YbaB
MDFISQVPLEHELKALKKLEEDGKYDIVFGIYEEIIDKFSSSKDENVQKIVSDIIEKKATLQQELIERKIIEENEKRIEENKEKIKELFDFYSDNARSIYDLIESIRKGHTTPLIGAGLSAFAGYPLWVDFLDKVYNDTANGIKDVIDRKDFESMSCIERASEIHNVLQQARFVREVKNYFSDTKMNKVNDDKLQEQPIYLLPDIFKDQLILTTNFDNLIQRVYENKNVHIIPTSTANIEMLDSLGNAKTVLYKIHGTIDIPKSIVLTESDYHKHYDTNSDNYKILNYRMKGKDILFLGCGLNEDDEILTFCANGDNYAIYPCKNKDNAQEIARKLGKKGIIPILYPPKNNHIYVKIILEYIADCISQKENDLNFKRTISRRGMTFESLMEQVVNLQGKVSDAQDELGEKVIIGSSENGCVIVKMSGKYDIVDLKIDDSYIDYSKKDLEKSIFSALLSAKEQTDAVIDEVMTEATVGMPLPDDF